MKKNPCDLICETTIRGISDSTQNLSHLSLNICRSSQKLNRIYQWPWFFQFLQFLKILFFEKFHFYLFNFEKLLHELKTLKFHLQTEKFESTPFTMSLSNFSNINLLAVWNLLIPNWCMIQNNFWNSYTFSKRKIVQPPFSLVFVLSVQGFVQSKNRKTSRLTKRV